MKISFLIPSYNRPQNLYNTINSIINNVYNDYEILIRCNDDDYNTINDTDINSLLYTYHNNLKLIVGDKLNGYNSLHEFYNELASVSTGDFICLYSDDMVVLNKNFDLELNKYSGDNIHYFLHNKVRGKSSDSGDYYFPIISRKLKNILNNKLSPIYLYDGYMLEYARQTNIMRRLNIDIEHIHLNDDTNISNSISHQTFLKTDTKEDSLKRCESMKNDVLKIKSNL